MKLVAIYEKTKNSKVTVALSVIDEGDYLTKEIFTSANVWSTDDFPIRPYLIGLYSETKIYCDDAKEAQAWTQEFMKKLRKYINDWRKIRELKVPADEEYEI